MTDHHSENHTDSFIRTARVIRHSGSVAEVASAVLRAVVVSAPRTLKDWRLRTVVRSTVESRLHRLELLISQKLATSPEMGSDMRRDAARHIGRVLFAISDNTELNANVAELAVNTTTHLSNSSEALARAVSSARDSNAKRPVAFATMSGRLFIATPALEFAREHGVDDSELNQILQRVMEPLRRACESEDVCRIGQLRYSSFFQEHGVTVRAELDTATDVRAAPLIRIELLAAKPGRVTTTPQAPPTPSNDAYSARLLRQLVR